MELNDFEFHTLEVKRSRKHNNNDIDIASLFANVIFENVKKLDSQDGNKPELKNTAQFHQTISDAIKKADYQTAIFELMELRDHNQNIHWHKISRKDTKLSHDLLIRDARDCTNLVESSEAYVIQALNFLRAAKALLGEKKFESVAEYLNLLIISFYSEAKTKNSLKEVINLFKDFNTVLISNLANVLGISFEEATERLSVAKDFANLEDQSYSIVTLTNLKNENKEDVTVFQGDIPVTELTTDIIHEYQTRKEQIWYKKLPDWQKELVDHYADSILEQNKVLPTQLRQILVGLKNAYRAVNGVIDAKNNEPVVTTDVYHSGTYVYLGKDEKENQRLARLHAEQLQFVTGTDNVLALTLNSDMNPTGHDKTIVKNSRNSMHMVGGTHANLPLNGIRIINANIYTGIHTYLKLAADKVLPILLKKYAAEKIFEARFFSDLGRYLTNQLVLNSSEEEQVSKFNSALNLLLNELQSTFNTKTEKTEIKLLCDILHVSVQTMNLINNNADLFDSENRNLIIASQMNLLVSKLHNLDKHVAINSSCESGKDRDGIVMFRTAMISFVDFLFNISHLQSKDEAINTVIQSNTTALAHAGHQQFLAGCQGGTYAAFGIKKDSSGALPKDFPKNAKSALILDTASYNKTIALHSDKQQQFYFPIKELNIEKQKRAILHVLNLRRESTKTLPTSPLGKFSALFKSTELENTRSHLLDGLIKDIPKAGSLDEIKSLIDRCAFFNKSLTDFTPYAIGETYKILTSLSQTLGEVISQDALRSFEN